MKKMHLPLLKRAAVQVYLSSPRRVQVGLAKFGMKKLVQKKLITFKKNIGAIS